MDRPAIRFADAFGERAMGSDVATVIIVGKPPHWGRLFDGERLRAYLGVQWVKT